MRNQRPVMAVLRERCAERSDICAVDFEHRQLMRLSATLENEAIATDRPQIRALPTAVVVCASRGVPPAAAKTMATRSVNCTNGPTELVAREGLRDDLRRGYWGASFVR